MIFLVFMIFESTPGDNLFRKFQYLQAQDDKIGIGLF